MFELALYIEAIADVYNQMCRYINTSYCKVTLLYYKDMTADIELLIILVSKVL